MHPLIGMIIFKLAKVGKSTGVRFTFTIGSPAVMEAIVTEAVLGRSKKCGETWIFEPTSIVEKFVNDNRLAFRDQRRQLDAAKCEQSQLALYVGCSNGEARGIFVSTLMKKHAKRKSER